MKTLPNILSLSRIFLTFVLVAIYYVPFADQSVKNISMCVIFSITAFTDLFDGYLARRFSWKTEIGKFLDPWADKLAVCTALLLLLHDQKLHLFIAIIIIGREITVTALREWLSQVPLNSSASVSYLGKWKTALQLTGISTLFYYDDLYTLPVFEIGTLLIYSAALLTIISMVDYMCSAFRDYKKKRPDNL